MKLSDVKKINLARFSDKRKNQKYLNEETEYLASEKSLFNNKNNNHDVNFDEIDTLRSSIVLTDRDEVNIRKIQKEVEKTFLNDRVNRESGYNNAKNINPKLLQKLRDEQDRLNRPINILANDGKRALLNNRYEDDYYEDDRYKEDFRVGSDYKNQAIKNHRYEEDYNDMDEEFDNLNPMEKRILSIVMPRVEDMIEVWAQDNLSEMIADIVQDEIERLYRKNKQSVNNYEHKSVSGNSHDYVNSDYISKILDSLNNKPSVDNNQPYNDNKHYDNKYNDDKYNDSEYDMERKTKRRDFESKKVRPRDNYEALFGNPSNKHQPSHYQDYVNPNRDTYQNNSNYKNQVNNNNDYYERGSNNSNNNLPNDSYSKYYNSRGDNNYDNNNYSKKDAMFYLTGKNHK
jgi:hypothetical protein